MAREQAEMMVGKMQHGELVDALMARGCEFNFQASEGDLRNDLLDDMVWNGEISE